MEPTQTTVVFPALLLLGFICAGALVVALVVVLVLWVARRKDRGLPPVAQAGAPPRRGQEHVQAANRTPGTSTTEARRCPECGVDLSPDFPEGLCPRCLLKAGVGSAADLPPSDPKQRTTPYPGPGAAATPAELAPRFPQLEVLELLGQGGMGAVYKARQISLNRVVALKVLPPEAGQDPAFVERFTREARALAKLSHPHIVAVHEFGQADGLCYFLMEYVDGVNLRQLMQSGPLPPSEALKVIPQICDALQYAHEEGVVHRDIKPENILLDRRGRVKIADFGLAKLLGNTSAAFTLTGTRQVMGTPHYMAPEQMERPLEVDHRADIYSLGVVFYEMLTGELPLGRFAPPSHKTAVDARLDEVVLRTLEKAPERRYQHASDVKTEVEAICTGPGAVPPAAGTVQAAVTRSAREAVRQQLRGPAGGLLLAGLTAVLLGVALILWSGWFIARVAAIPTEKQPISFGGMTGTVTYTHQPTWPEWLLLISQVLAVGAGGVTLLAAWSLQKLEFPQLARVGSILAMVPLSPAWLLGLPTGIWALLTLHKPQVRAAFDLPPPEGQAEEDQVVALLRQRLSTVAGWGRIVCLLGAGATFLPWASLSVFGITTTMAGFDSWQGVVSGSVFLAAFLLLVALDWIKPASLARALVLIPAGLTGVVVPAISLWEMFRGPTITHKQTTGDTEVLGGLMDTFANTMLGGMHATPLLGPYVALALGVGLLALGLAQLRQVRPKQTGALLAAHGS